MIQYIHKIKKGRSKNEEKTKTKKVHENSRVKKDVVDDKSNINKEDKKD